MLIEMSGMNRANKDNKWTKFSMEPIKLSFSEEAYIRRKPFEETYKTPSPKGHRSIAKNRSIVDILASVEKLIIPGAKSTLVISTLANNFIDKGVTTLPDWRRLTDKTKAVLYHIALSSLAVGSVDLKVVPFTLNLTNDVINRARLDDKNFASWLRDRIQQNLKRATGRPVQFFYQIEIDVKGNRGRPHVHGELLLTQDEASKPNIMNPVRQALHRINNYSRQPSFKNWALKFDLNRCDSGWVRYTTKHLNISKLFLGGQLLTCTDKCSSMARVLWEELRAAIEH